jgi:ribosome-associated protein
MSLKSPTPDDLDRAGEIRFEFYRSSGPGGQNVNKVATAVRLRFDVRRSQLLPEAAKERLAHLGGARLTSRGVLVIESQRFRTQERNREDALSRLGLLLHRASQAPRERRATKPSRESRQRRLESKRRRSRIKTARGRGMEPED